MFAYFMSQFGLMRFKQIVYNNIITCIRCDRCLVHNNFACRTLRRMSLSLELKSGGNDYLLQVQAYTTGQHLAEAFTMLTLYAGGRTMYFL